MGLYELEQLVVTRTMAPALQQTCDRAAGTFVISFDNPFWDGWQRNGCRWTWDSFNMLGHEGFSFEPRATVQGFWRDTNTGGVWQFIGQMKFNGAP